MICAICRREAKGFGWQDMRFSRNDKRRLKTAKWFCSKHCQDIRSIIIKEHGKMIDPTENEKQAMEQAIKPLGELVAGIGMQKPLADYSRDEIIQLIDVVVTNFQENLRNLNDECPF